MRRLAVAVVFALGLVGGVGPLWAAPPHTHELSNHGTSGYWTSNTPAVGAYRYRLLLLGCAIVVAMGYLMFRLLKRASADRAASGDRFRHRD